MGAQEKGMFFGDIALIMSSGEAYYKLVTELKKRKINFISLSPTDPIPINVRAIITTELEKNKISDIYNLQKFVYNSDDEPALIIEQVIQLLMGKKTYDKLVFGVDPGKSIGLAVMVDGSILETQILSNIEDVAKKIVRIMNKIDSKEKKVKIGKGSSVFHSSFIKILKKELPPEAIIELIEEKGTTKHSRFLFQKKMPKDIDSAIRISLREGKEINRRRKNA